MPVLRDSSLSPPGHRVRESWPCTKQGAGGWGQAKPLGRVTLELISQGSQSFARWMEKMPQ